MTLTKKNFLIITDWYLPAFKAGGPVQSIHNLAEALKSEYNIFIFTSDRDLGDDHPFEGISLDVWTQSSGVHIFYASQKSVSRKKYRQLLMEIKPATIYLNSLFSRQFTILPLLVYKQYADIRLVLAPRGMLHAGALRYKAFRKQVFIWVVNRFRLFNNFYFHATDEREASDIRKSIKRFREIRVISNVPTNFDYEYSRPVKSTGALKLVYLARIAPNKNLKFVLQLLASGDLNGTIELTIAGQAEDENYWIICQHLISSMPRNVQVHVTGAVPHHEVLDFLQPFHFYILPTFGENFGHGIFEAFLAGKPVIISDQTPWQDLRSRGLGWDIPLADSATFKEAIQQAIDLDQAGYDRMSASSHAFAIDYRQNNDTRNKYIQLFG